MADIIFGHLLTFEQMRDVIKASNPQVYESIFADPEHPDMSSICDYCHEGIRGDDGTIYHARLIDESDPKVIVGIKLPIREDTDCYYYLGSFNAQDLFSNISRIGSMRIPGFTSSQPPRVYTYISIP